MKNKIKLFSIFVSIYFILSFLSLNNVYAGNLRMNNLDFNVVVNEDASMDVTEKWRIRIDETNTLFKSFDIDKTKFSDIDNVSVKDLTNNVEFKKFTQYSYHVPKNFFYALDMKNSTYEIAWGIGMDETSGIREYEIKYTVNDAIAFSLNTVAVTTLEEVGLLKSYEYLQKFGITSIDKKNDMYYPCLALGGLTKGVSPYEMTQAYNALSNDGTFRNISTINHIDIQGKTITKNKNEHQVISIDAANMLKTSLNAAARYGTSGAATDQIALKTGTTNNVKDIWTCGFTDDITACLWAGFDTPEKIPIYNVNTVWKQLVEYYYNR